MAGLDEITCKLKGYRITGLVILKDFSDSFYTIKILENEPLFYTAQGLSIITNSKLKKIIRNVGFQCKSIDSATLHIDKVYTPINSLITTAQDLIIKYKQNINLTFE
jgi:hypothetical protein